MPIFLYGARKSVFLKILMVDKKSVNKKRGKIKKSVKKTTRSSQRNLPSAGEYASENQSLHSDRSTETSSRLPVGIRNKINVCDKTFPSTNIFVSSRELRNRSNRSRSADALVSPRQNPTVFFTSIKARGSKTNPRFQSSLSHQENSTASSTAVLEHSKASGSKINKINRSLGEKLDADVASPPELGIVTRSVSKILQKFDSPSPEKRNVEMNATCTPTKRQKKVPQSSSFKSATEKESYRSKVKLQAAVKNIHTSPTDLQIQKTKSTTRKNEKTLSLITSSTPSGRKKKITKRSSVALNTNDSSKLNLRSASSAANIVHTSATNQQALESKVTEQNVEESDSVIEEEILVSFQGNLLSSSTDSDPSENRFSPDGLLLTGSVLNLVADKHESAVYLSTVTDSLTSSNLDRGKSKDSLSVSDVSAESEMPNLPSKESETIVHPSTVTDTYLFSPRNDQRKQIPPIVLFEACQPDLPDNQLLHPHKITDGASGSNLETTPEHRYSTNENCASSDLSITKIDGQALKSPRPCPIILNPHLPLSTSKVVDSGSETENLHKSFLPRPVILNPHFPLSCHLSVRRLPLGNKSPVIPDRHPVLKCDTCDRKNGIDQNQSDSSVGISTPNLELRSQSKESPTSGREMHLKSVCDEISTSKILPGDKAQRHQFNSLLKSLLMEATASKSPRESTRDMNQMFRIVQPRFERIPPRPASNMTLASRNMPEFQSQFSQFNQLLMGMTETPSSSGALNLSLKVRYNTPESQIQQNRSDPLLKRKPARSITSEPSRNRSTVESSINRPYIGVFEGEAFTSRYQPVIKDASSDDCPPVVKGGSSDDRPPVVKGGSSDDNPPVVKGGSSDDNPPVVKGGSSDDNPPVVKGGSSDDNPPVVKDGSPDDNPLSDDHHSENPGEQTPEKNKSFISSRPVRLPEYSLQAQMLLQSVLREILMFNGESDQWKEFDVLFNRVTESSSEMDRMNLCTELLWYLAQKEYGLRHQNLLKFRAVTAETYTLAAYEILTTVVFTVLASLVTVQSGLNFDRILLNYESFRNLYDTFSQYWENGDVEFTDESTRNHLTSLKKMVLRLLLVIHTAFQLLLIYIGENAEENAIETYEKKLSEEDKKYLRRKN